MNPTRACHRILPALSIYLLFVLSGCLAPYQPPAPSLPHATLTVSFSYDEVSGEKFNESLEINGQSALNNQYPSEAAKRRRASRFLAHPGTTSFGVYTIFFTDEERLIPEELRPYGRMLGGSCLLDRSYVLRAGHNYALDFTYEFDRVCTLKCRERTQLPNGQVNDVACVDAS
jgi:hypothetical protein